MSDRLAYSIAEFCAAVSISRGSFYNLKKAGNAPATMRVGRRTLVSVEAAELWRREMERAALPPAIPQRTAK